jgi:hypothetical protein
MNIVSFPPTPALVASGVSRQRRERVEHAIEALIALLDTLDGDPDMEDDDVSEDADTGIADDGGLMEQTHRLPSPA